MRRSFLTALFMLFLAHLQAQTIYDVYDSTPRIAVKWNPESLLFGKIGLSGEYHYAPKRSLTFYAGIPMEATTKWNINDEKRSVTMRTWSAMAGYRMYLGNGNMQGLYFEPFLKYMGSKGSCPYMDTETIDSTVYLLTSKYSGVGLGAQLGVQLMIARKFTIDFFFLGPEANISKWDIDLQDQSEYAWDAQDAQEALDILNDLVDDLPDFIGKNVETSVETSSKTVKAKFNGFLPGVRFGVSVGFRF